MSRLLLPSLFVGAGCLSALIVLELASFPAALPAARPGPAATPAGAPADQPDPGPAQAAALLARPPFAPDRRPEAAQGALDPLLPHLTGIMMSAADRRAIFAGRDGGRGTVVGQGDQLAGYRVEAISATAVTLVGADGRHDVHPTFSAAPPVQAALQLPALQLPRRNSPRRQSRRRKSLRCSSRRCRRAPARRRDDEAAHPVAAAARAAGVRATWPARARPVAAGHRAVGCGGVADQRFRRRSDGPGCAADQPRRVAQRATGGPGPAGQRRRRHLAELRRHRHSRGGGADPRRAASAELHHRPRPCKRHRDPAYGNAGVAGAAAADPADPAGAEWRHPGADGRALPGHGRRRRGAGWRRCGHKRGGAGG